MTTQATQTGQLLGRLGTIVQQLDDVMREKGQVLAELARLQRRRRALSALLVRTQWGKSEERPSCPQIVLQSEEKCLAKETVQSPVNAAATNDETLTVPSNQQNVKTSQPEDKDSANSEHVSNPGCLQTLENPLEHQKFQLSPPPQWPPQSSQPLATLFPLEAPRSASKNTGVQKSRHQPGRGHAQRLAVLNQTPGEIAALSYMGSTPAMYLQDKDGQAGRQLQLPDGAEKILEEALKGDDCQAFNGRQPAEPTNLAGLGGPLGPRLDFGARTQAPANTTRFLDELQKPAFAGLQPRRDVDGDFTRVNCAQARLFESPWLVGLHHGAAGPVPATRVMQEAPLLQAEHRMITAESGWVEVDDGGFDESDGGFSWFTGKTQQIGAEPGPRARVKIADFFAAVRVRERERLRALCKEERRRVVKRASESSFGRDVAWLRAKVVNSGFGVGETPADALTAVNPYYSQDLLSKTRGWAAEMRAYERLRPFLERGVRNYGRWCVDPGHQVGVPVWVGARDALLVRGLHV